MTLLISFFALVLCQPITFVQNDQPDAVASSPELASIRRILEPVTEHNKNASVVLGREPIRYVDAIDDSGWRTNVSRVIRILIHSPATDDRKIGWMLASEYGYQANWTSVELQLILNEPDVSTKSYAIHSVAKTDQDLLTSIIEPILSNPNASCRRSCVAALSEVPHSDERLRLWLKAADDPVLKPDCVSKFSCVSWSKEAIDVVSSSLDDLTPTNYSLTPDTIMQRERRISACWTLLNTTVNKPYAAEKIWNHLQDLQPTTENNEFFLAAIITHRRLAPESREPERLVIKWYETVPEIRPTMLQDLEGVFSDTQEFEKVVLASTDKLEDRFRYCVCQWLSGQRSPESKTELVNLLNDSHPGTRLAALVAITTVDPLYDVSDQREELFAKAIERPNDFLLPFDEMGEALGTLACAGQSKKEAQSWLEKKKPTAMGENLRRCRPRSQFCG